MPIVDGGDFSLDVIQDLFHGQPRNSHSRHQACGGAPEIMANKIDFRGLLDPLQRFLRISDVRISFGAWKDKSRITVVYYG